jgi:hypothetical protein
VAWCFHGQHSERKMDAQVLTDGRGVVRFGSQIWMTTVPQKGISFSHPPWPLSSSSGANSSQQSP